MIFRFKTSFGWVSCIPEDKNNFISDPSGRNADVTPLFVGGTREFRLLITLPVSALVTAIFIRIVQTIVVSVADVNPRDAVAIVAREQVAETRPRSGFAIFRLIRT